MSTAAEPWLSGKFDLRSSRRLSAWRRRDAAPAAAGRRRSGSRRGWIADRGERHRGRDRGSLGARAREARTSFAVAIAPACNVAQFLHSAVGEVRSHGTRRYACRRSRGRAAIVRFCGSDIAAAMAPPALGRWNRTGWCIPVNAGTWPLGTWHAATGGLFASTGLIRSSRPRRVSLRASRRMETSPCMFLAA